MQHTRLHAHTSTTNFVLYHHGTAEYSIYSKVRVCACTRPSHFDRRKRLRAVTRHRVNTLADPALIEDPQCPRAPTRWPPARETPQKCSRLLRRTPSAPFPTQVIGTRQHSLEPIFVVTYLPLTPCRKLEYLGNSIVSTIITKKSVNRPPC